MPLRLDSPIEPLDSNATLISSALNDSDTLSYLTCLNKPHVESNACWQLVRDNDIKKLVKTYSFANYRASINFVNRIADFAEAVDHHPDITIQWGQVSLMWYTHRISGLHLNDFRCAYRCDQLYT